MAEQLNLKDLKAIVEQQGVAIAWMQQVLATQQIKGPWVSPAKAAELLGVSRDRIMQEVGAAEACRAIQEKHDLAYGQHYRNIQDPSVSGERATWQINFVEFQGILNTPPDRRNLG